MKQMTRTQVRIPSDLMDWVKQQAKEQNRSMNSQLVDLLSQLKRQAA
ncbi:transcriptional regulator [Pseudomonas sp. RW407]|nr:Arc family DNA-binding protein [Pseudomonas sp. RW407]PWU30742.1 transcriptional regulator [Pseudomonas sp. RW407]PWU32175.1 transcriptional regulator [Pseudomonas sp. RW407]